MRYRKSQRLIANPRNSIHNPGGATTLPQTAIYSSVARIAEEVAAKAGRIAGAEEVMNGGNVIPDPSFFGSTYNREKAGTMRAAIQARAETDIGIAYNKLAMKLQDPATRQEAVGQFENIANGIRDELPEADMKLQFENVARQQIARFVSAAQELTQTEGQEAAEVEITQAAQAATDSISIQSTPEEIEAAINAARRTGDIAEYNRLIEQLQGQITNKQAIIRAIPDMKPLDKMRWLSRHFGGLVGTDIGGDKTLLDETVASNLIREIGQDILPDTVARYAYEQAKHNIANNKDITPDIAREQAVQDAYEYARELHAAGYIDSAESIMAGVEGAAKLVTDKFGAQEAAARQAKADRDRAVREAKAQYVSQAERVISTVANANEEQKRRFTDALSDNVGNRLENIQNPDIAAFLRGYSLMSQDKQRANRYWLSYAENKANIDEVWKTHLYETAGDSQEEKTRKAEIVGKRVLGGAYQRNDWNRMQENILPSRLSADITQRATMPSINPEATGDDVAVMEGEINRYFDQIQSTNMVGDEMLPMKWQEEEEWRRIASEKGTNPKIAATINRALYNYNDNGVYDTTTAKGMRSAISDTSAVVGVKPEIGIILTEQARALYKVLGSNYAAEPQVAMRVAALIANQAAASLAGMSESEYREAIKNKDKNIVERTWRAGASFDFLPPFTGRGGFEKSVIDEEIFGIADMMFLIGEGTAKIHGIKDGGRDAEYKGNGDELVMKLEDEQWSLRMIAVNPGGATEWEVITSRGGEVVEGTGHRLSVELPHDWRERATAKHDEEVDNRMSEVKARIETYRQQGAMGGYFGDWRDIHQRYQGVR